ncbi:MAG: hypothetical protein K2G97_04285, partial [Oscillospiraceae bacterium]|nr:hypothetical protein [Oscillospiraceae bacterium]
MKQKRILSIILTISIIVTSFLSVVQISAQTEEASNQVVQVAATEDGSVQTVARPIEPTKKFIISSKYDFALFMTTSEFWESNYKVTLACDIDMGERAFNPIKEFDGVFDGCGHTISNLKIQDKSGKSKNAELSFINTLNENAEIENVKFDNYTIEGKSYIKKVAVFVLTNYGIISGIDFINGGINGIDEKARTAGFVLSNEEDGAIENCFINMNTNGSKIRSGFVGTNLGKITKCSTTLSSNNKDLAGGFVGENVGAIEKCNSKGNVESKKCAGGFCGKNSGEIISCKSENNVTSKTKSTKVATICGGFVGENSGIIKESRSAGKVEGQEFTGGFAGINNDYGEIISCDTTCYVKSHTYVANINCGGFVGLDEGKIENCTFDGKVDGCVDSEKVVGTAVGIAVGIIAIAAGIRLLVKKYYTIPKLKNEVKNAENECYIAEDAYNKLTGDQCFDGQNELAKYIT